MPKGEIHETYQSMISRIHSTDEEVLLNLAQEWLEARDIDWDELAEYAFSEVQEALKSIHLGRTQAPVASLASCVIIGFELGFELAAQRYAGSDPRGPG